MGFRFRNQHTHINRIAVINRVTVGMGTSIWIPIPMEMGWEWEWEWEWEYDFPLWGSPWGFLQKSCGNGMGMGMGMEIPFPRQAGILV